MNHRIAVIGGGVAGLSAAYALRDTADITVFDADDRLGGHANTIEVTEGDRTIGLDTAFIIFNDDAYPNFSRFLDELGVDAVTHQGGFNLYDMNTGTQFGTREFDLTEDEIAASYPEPFVQMWREADRFHKEAPRDFLRKKADIPLGEYLDARGYSDAFRHGYVVQLATAVWSIPPELIWTMPASTLIAFFMAHDAEGLGGRSVHWKTVVGGSISYVRKAVAAVKPALRLSEPVLAVSEDATGVDVTTASGTQRFDVAILAAHADDALAMLRTPTPQQQRISCIAYNPAEAILHTDTSVMPADRSRWMSWNFGQLRDGDTVHSWPVYYLNAIQGLDAEKDYFVTLDCPLPVAEEHVIRRLHFRHPVITAEVRALQSSIYQVHRDTRVLLAGSYIHSKVQGPDQIGSHEAGFSSGMEAATAAKRVLAADAARVPVAGS